jgi:hypothetical protein
MTSDDALVSDIADDVVRCPVTNKGSKEAAHKFSCEPEFPAGLGTNFT